MLVKQCLAKQGWLCWNVASKKSWFVKTSCSVTSICFYDFLGWKSIASCQCRYIQGARLMVDRVGQDDQATGRFRQSPFNTTLALPSCYVRWNQHKDTIEAIHYTSKLKSHCFSTKYHKTTMKPWEMPFHSRIFTAWWDQEMLSF